MMSEKILLLNGALESKTKGSTKTTGVIPALRPLGPSPLPEGSI